MNTVKTKAATIPTSGEKANCPEMLPALIRIASCFPFEIIADCGGKWSTHMFFIRSIVVYSALLPCSAPIQNSRRWLVGV